jgi:hypothetical protein
MRRQINPRSFSLNHRGTETPRSGFSFVPLWFHPVWSGRIPLEAFIRELRAIRGQPGWEVPGFLASGQTANRRI